MNFKPNMLFLNRSFDKKRLKALLLWFRLNLSENAALKAVEILQGLGFRSATQGAISLGLDDLKTPASKGGRVFQAQVEVALAHHEHHRGNRTPVELFQHLVDTWHRTSQDLTTEVVQLFHSTERVNPVYMMAFSGARGNISQVRQLVGMRGLMADPRGQIVGFPILSNFREGLTITEYFVSCYGARKGVVDTAIRTADAGYLTRRLADVSHHVVVRTTNCGTHESILLRDIKEGQKTILSLANRLVGRVLAEHVFLPASLAKTHAPLGVSYSKSSGASAAYASPDLLTELANEKRACCTNPVRGKVIAGEYKESEASGTRQNFALQQNFSLRKNPLQENLPANARADAYPIGASVAELPLQGDPRAVARENSRAFAEADAALSLANIRGSDPFGDMRRREDKTKIIIYRNSEITSSLAEKLAAHYSEVPVRSPLSCSLPWGVCQLCYGWGLSEGRRVTLGEAVGIIAAQSIGEPGTQLTLRTFHTGGVFSGELLNEIRAPYNGKVIFPTPLQGLLLRTPHGQIAFLTKVSGKMKISETEIYFESKRENLDTLIPLKDDKNHKANSLVNPQRRHIPPRESATSPNLPQYVQNKISNSLGVKVAKRWTGTERKEGLAGEVSLEEELRNNGDNELVQLTPSGLKSNCDNEIQQHEEYLEEKQIDKINDIKSELDLSKQNAEFLIQPSTVIFVKQKEHVVNNQLLAEFSSSTLQSVNDQIEITQQVLSDIAGQIWFKELEYGNRKGPGSGSLGTYFSSQKLGGIWVLAGKPIIDTHPSFASPLHKSSHKRQLSYCAKQSLLQIEDLYGVPQYPKREPQVCVGSSYKSYKSSYKSSSRRIPHTNLRFSGPQRGKRVGGTATCKSQRFAAWKILNLKGVSSATCTTRPEKVSTESKAKFLFSFTPGFVKKSENSVTPLGTPEGYALESNTALSRKGYEKSLKSFIPLVTIVRGKQKLQIKNNISSNIITEINAYPQRDQLKNPFTLRVNIDSYNNTGNKYKSQIRRTLAQRERGNATNNVVIRRNEGKVAKLTPYKSSICKGLRLVDPTLRYNLLEEELRSNGDNELMQPTHFVSYKSSICKGLRSNCDNEIVNEVSPASGVNGLITSPSINIFTNTNILLHGTKINLFSNCDKFLVFNNFVLSNLILSPKINESLLKGKNLFKYHIYGIQNRLKRSRNTRFAKTCSLPLSLLRTDPRRGYVSASIINLENNSGCSLLSSDVLKHDYVLGYSQAVSSKKHIPSIYFSCEATFQHNCKPLLFKYRKNNKFIIYAKQQRDLENRAMDKSISNECHYSQTANDSSIVLRTKLKRGSGSLKQSFAEVNKPVKALRVITLSQYVQSKVTNSSYKSKSSRIPAVPLWGTALPHTNLRFSEACGGTVFSCKSKSSASTLCHFSNAALLLLAQRRALSRIPLTLKGTQRVGGTASTRITHDKSFERIENKIKKSISVFKELHSSESQFILMQNKTRGSDKKLNMLPLLSESDLVTFVTNYDYHHTQDKPNVGQMLLHPAGVKIKADYLKRPLQGFTSHSSWQNKEKLAPIQTPFEGQCEAELGVSYSLGANQRKGTEVEQRRAFSRLPHTNLRFSPHTSSHTNQRFSGPQKGKRVGGTRVGNTANSNFVLKNSLENVISLSSCTPKGNRSTPKGKPEGYALEGIPVLPSLAPYFNKTSFSFSTSLSSFNVFSNRSLLANYYPVCSFPSPVRALLALPHTNLSMRVGGIQLKPFSKTFALHLRKLLPCKSNADAALKSKRVSTTRLLTKTWGLLQRNLPHTNLRFSGPQRGKHVGGTGASNYVNKSYLSTILINKEIAGDNRNNELRSTCANEVVVLTKNNSCDNSKVITMNCFVSQGNKSSYFFTEKRRLQSTWIQKKRAYLTYLNQVCSIPFRQQFTKNTNGYTTEAFTNFISRTNLQLSTFNNDVIPSKNSLTPDKPESRRIPHTNLRFSGPQRGTAGKRVGGTATCKELKSNCVNEVQRSPNNELKLLNGHSPCDAALAPFRGNPPTITRVFPGQLVTYGDNITSNIVTTESGQVLYIDSQKTTVRKAQTVLIYSQAIIAVLSGDWIKKGTPLMSLSYQKLVTGDIVQGLPKIEQFFEAPVLRDGTFWSDSLQAKLNQFFQEEREKLPLAEAVRKGFSEIQRVLVEGVLRVYISQGVLIADKHLEVIVRQMTCKGRILYSGDTGFLRNELVSLDKIENVNQVTYGQKALYHPQVRGITDASLESESFLSAASFQETTRVLSRDAIIGKTDLMRGLKERVIVGELIQAGTGLANNSVYNLLAHSVA